MTKNRITKYIIDITCFMLTFYWAAGEGKDGNSN